MLLGSKRYGGMDMQWGTQMKHGLTETPGPCRTTSAVSGVPVSDFSCCGRGFTLGRGRGGMIGLGEDNEAQERVAGVRGRGAEAESCRLGGACLFFLGPEAVVLGRASSSEFSLSCAQWVAWRARTQRVREERTREGAAGARKENVNTGR